MTSAQTREIQTMKRFAILLTSAALAALALAPTAHAEFGIEPGSFLAKTHPTAPLLVVSGAGPADQRAVDIAAIEAAPPLTAAGGHPDATTRLVFNRVGSVLEDNPKDVDVELPPGFLGNPEAVPACARADFTGMFSPGFTGACSPASQVGVTTIGLESGCGACTYPVYRLTRSFGSPASFGIPVIGLVGVVLNARLRSDGDYGVTVRASEINGTPFGLMRSTVTFWGAPADPVHDAERWSVTTGDWGAGADTASRALLSNPTYCDSGPLDTAIHLRSWQDPTRWLPDDPADPDYHSVSPAPTECDRLRFGGPAAPASLTFQPTIHAAETPSGYNAHLSLPYNDNPDGLANPTLRDTEVVLPEGVVVNPSSASGLAACTSEQIGFLGSGFPEPAPIRFSAAPAACPDASKLGTVEVTTPLLDHRLKGAVYLAKQGDNPFGSLLAIYIAVDDPQTGTVVKLAGKVNTDPATGRITSTFADNPQLPFTELDLDFFGGPGASLVNPATCGKKTTTTVLTPWSAPYTPPVTSTDSFTINSGPNGSPCANSESELPNSPSLEAGTVTPLAGSYSPFVLHLKREDGSQQLKGLDVTLPPGLTGKLAGVPYCPEAAIALARSREGKPGQGAVEQAAPSCPAASQVGSVNVGAGAGPQPLHVQGKAYLAGPYKGAPLSLVIVTPAVAGPFDLGVVAVRVALHVDPQTAQIRAASDPIPHILEVEGDGFPLDVRSVSVEMDRPDFTLNPTDCSELSIGGSALSVLGQVAPLANRFQVGACAALGFKPRLFLRLLGGTGRGAHPQLRAVLMPREGDANISRAAVSLPSSELLDQSNIRTVCTRVQFAADACPQGSVYGRAVAYTPLLEEPLRGPVYLRSSSNKLPDLVAALRGPDHQPIEIELGGRIDSVRGGIRSTFSAVPDAPVSKFILTMQGGKKGLLVNSRNICASTNRATARFKGQNGRRHNFRPQVNNDCKRRKKARKRHRGNQRTSFLGRLRGAG